MICAVCLAQGRPLVGHDDSGWAHPAITIANGQALCHEHFDTLSDWQNEVHGHLSLLALLDVVSPDEPPDQ